MEKYENIVKSSEIRKLVEQRMFQKALTILDTLDTNRVKMLTDLSVFAEVYMQTERYDEAEEILLRIRERSNNRRVIYQLIRLAVKTKRVEDAEYYYNEYIKVAPKDSEKYILRYRIDKMRGEDYSILIEPLEKLKEYDYIEKWAYELAKLYHKAGMKDNCVRECSDIILWFGEGVIVEKAKALKSIYVQEVKPVQSIQASTKQEISLEMGLSKTKDLSEVQQHLQSLDEEIEIDDEIAREAIDNLTKRFSKQLEELERKEEEPEVEEESEVEEEPEVEKELEEEAEPETSNIETVLAKEVEMMVESEGYKNLYNDDEIKQIFGSYLFLPQYMDPILSVLYECKKQRQIQQFAIMGENQEELLMISKNIAKVCYNYGLTKSSQIAKISASKLIQVDLSTKYDKLKGGFLIITDVCELNSHIVVQLVDMICTLKGQIVVIFEGRKSEVEQVLDKYAPLKEYVSHFIELPIIQEQNVCQCVEQCFANFGFQLDESALTYLTDQIPFMDIVASSGQYRRMLEFVQAAIKRQEQRIIGYFKNKNGKDVYEQIAMDVITQSDIVSE